MRSNLQTAIDLLGGQTSLAKSLHLTQGTVWQWANGLRPIPPRRAIEIERLTAGQVRAEALCTGFEFERTTDGLVTGYRVPIGPTDSKEAA